METEIDGEYFLRLVVPELHVRTTPMDALLVTLGFGTIVALLVIFMLYLITRLFRQHRNRDGQITRSKADRPLWVFGLVFSASVLIICSLLFEGAMITSNEITISCTLIRYLGQYGLGFPLWISLVLYKLVRKYYQYRVVKRKPPHALLTIFLLMLPFMINSVCMIVFDQCTRGIEGQCRVWDLLSVSTYALLAIYLCVFIVLMVKIRRTIGDHHEVIRYSIFLSTSFLYPLLDAVVHLTPLTDRLLFGELLVILVIVLVVGHMAHIFALVFKNKSGRLPRGILPNSNDIPKSPAIMSLSSISSLTVQDPSDESALEATEYTRFDDPLPRRYSQNVSFLGMTQRPRRLLQDEMLPDFERFVASLPDELAAQVDRNRGFFAESTNQNAKTRTVVEFDLDHASKYLE